MGKTVSRLLTLSVVLLGAAAISFYVGAGHPDMALANQAEASILHVGTSERWYMLAGLLTLIAAALGLAGIKLWIQERAESRGHNRRAV